MASKRDAQQRWILLKEAFLKGKRKEVTNNPEVDFEYDNPEFCIRLLQDPTVKNYYCLKKYLINSSNSWMVEFLELSGLDLMLEALDRLSSRGVPKIYDALLQLTCVNCVRAVMNSQNGIEHIVKNEKHIRKLLQALDTSVILVKKQVFELLAALCMYSPEGHNLVLHALQHYKNVKKHHYRFSAIMNELQTDNVPYAVTLLSVINAIILGTENLQSRTRLRNEFIGLHLLDVLSVLKKQEDGDLLIQCLNFEEANAEDDEELTKIYDGTDMNSHQEVFTALFNKVSTSPVSIQLLSILQGLLRLQPSNSCSPLLWEALENLVNRAIQIADDTGPEIDVDTIMKRLLSVKLKTNDQPVKEELIISKPENHDCSEPESSTEESLKCVHATTTPFAPPPPPPLPPPQPLLLIPPPPPPPPVSSGSLLTASDKTGVPRPSLRMKKLSWQKLSSNAISERNSFWSLVQSISINPDFASIEQLFSFSISQTKEKDQALFKKESKEVTFLDPKKSLNLNICLKQFRCSNEELADMVQKGRKSKFDVEVLKQFKKLLPEKHEPYIISWVTEQKGYLLSDLGQCFNIQNYGEAFDFSWCLLLMIQQAMSYGLTACCYAKLQNCHRPDAELVKKACENLLSASRLPHFCHLILKIGNFLNYGSATGNADGFKVNSLLKLKETKARQPQITLLHYAVEEVEKSYPDLLNLPDDLKSISEAASIKIDLIQSEVNRLSHRLKKISNDIMSSIDDVKLQFRNPIQQGLTISEELKNLLKAIEYERKQVAEYFCEDQNKFSLDELFITLKTFSELFLQAIKDNHERKEQEAKMKRRQQQLAMQEAKGINETNEYTTKQDRNNIVEKLLFNIKKGFLQKRNSITRCKGEFTPKCSTTETLKDQVEAGVCSGTVHK